LRPVEQQEIKLVGRADGETQTIGGEPRSGKTEKDKIDKETVDAD
jgi:hypothetical protein